MTQQNIADNLNIDKATVSHVIALFNTTGDIKNPEGKSHHLCKLTEIDHGGCS